MQIGKSTPLPHRIAYSIIPCCIYVCVPISVWHADFCLCFPQTCILSHRMLEWCRTAFICVRPLITRCIMTPYPWLALSCFALLQPLSLSLTASLFPSPLLFLSVAAFLRSVPLSVVKEWQTHGRDKKREAGISNSSLRRYSWTISSGSLLDFCWFLCWALRWPLVKDGSAWTQS